MKVYYGSDPELKQLVNDPCSAYGSHQESEDDPESEPAPAYTSYTEHREGERIYLDVRESKPVKLDGFDI